MTRQLNPNDRPARPVTQGPWRKLEEEYKYLDVPADSPESVPIYRSPRGLTHTDQSTPISSGQGSRFQKLSDNREVLTVEAKRVPPERPTAWTQWEYIRSVRLGLGRRFVTAQYKDRNRPGHFLIEKLPGSAMWLQWKKMNHDNIMRAVYSFSIDEHFMVVTPYMPLTLREVAGNSRLDDNKAAAILSQVLTGLGYLHKNNLEHGHLNCTNVMINFEGVAKLSIRKKCAELPSKSSKSKSKDIQGMGHLTEELVNGGVGPKGPKTAVKNASMVEVLDFLAGVECVQNLEDFWKHGLFSLNYASEDLRPFMCDLVYSTSWDAEPTGDVAWLFSDQEEEFSSLKEFVVS